MPLAIRVYEQHELRYTAECPGAIDIGRDKGDETPGRPVTTNGGTRFVIDIPAVD